MIGIYQYILRKNIYIVEDIYIIGILPCSSRACVNSTFPDTFKQLLCEDGSWYWNMSTVFFMSVLAIGTFLEPF